VYVKNITSKVVAVSAALVVAISLTGCTNPEPDVVIAVKQDAQTCELTQTEFAAGIATFAIENVGETTAEFYILKADGEGIVAEVENIGAGLTRELTAELAEGTYIYSCEQMDGGTPIRGNLTVSAAKTVATVSPEAQAAIDAYKAFVEAEAATLLTGTTEFAAAVTAKNVAEAKALYAPTRVAWERIEPVAESFGDLDPKMDAREGDLDPGVAWTGWHALEKQLWVTGLQADAPALADQLVADTKDLVTRISNIELTLSQVSNGAKELLDEVATGKVTGEEERYSHTDLWDFEANVYGALKAVEVSRSILETKDAALLAELDAAFAALNSELDMHRVGEGFKLYTDLTPAEVKALATLVEACSEPLSKMTAALVK
jgi:iron uptake system component EfeO